MLADRLAKTFDAEMDDVLKRLEDNDLGLANWAQR